MTSIFNSRNANTLALFARLFRRPDAGGSGSRSTSSQSAQPLPLPQFSLHTLSQAQLTRVQSSLTNSSIPTFANQIQLISTGTRTLLPLTAGGGAAIPFSLEPPKEMVEKAYQEAGGAKALREWAVDGKTKLRVGQSVVVVDVETGQVAKPAENGSGQSVKAPPTIGQATEAASAALGRFGVNADVLNGDFDKARDIMRAAADALKQGMTQATADSVDYSLEDAFAKLRDLEDARARANASGSAAPAPSRDEARKKNEEQFNSIVEQSSLDASQQWGVKSVGEDLAVFGLDYTALGKSSSALITEIGKKREEMLADLSGRYTGTEADYLARKNQIEGAATRLITGAARTRSGDGCAIGELQQIATLRQSSLFANIDVTNGSLGGTLGEGFFSAGMQVSSSSFDSSKVSLGGVKIDLSVIISMGTAVSDPVVLDLGGDGIDLGSAEEGVEFDMNGDGEKTRMGFIRGDDAFLFLDRDGDGVATSGKELFGNTDGYANGFEMLRAYDENNDGVIDENDSIYDQLRLWQEKTADGVCDASEVMTLREAGVKSINVGYADVRKDDGKGNLIGQEGSFTRTNGEQGLAADVWLREGKA